MHLSCFCSVVAVAVSTTSTSTSTSLSVLVFFLSLLLCETTSDDASAGCPFVFRRHRYNGIFVCDFCEFFKDDSEVFAFVATECSGDVFPHHISWSNIDTCSPISFISFSHLLCYSYLFHEETASLSIEASSFACDRKVLTGTPSDNAIDYRSGISAYFSDISEMLHKPPR